MKKSKDISKFDVDWQVFRVGLKDLKTHMDKAEAAADFLLSHRDRASKERVLNFMQGLSLAYSGQDREDIVSLASVLDTLEVSDANIASSDFSTHPKASLQKLAKDLFLRTKKWLQKGYRHEEQIAFLERLIDYLGDHKMADDLEGLIEFSLTIPNTHKFFF